MDRWWNHSDEVTELKECGIKSLYHKFQNEQQGKETNPTLYFQRKLHKPYPIDYVFGAQKFSKNLKKIEIGQRDEWIGFSDHVPVLCEIDL